MWWLRRMTTVTTGCAISRVRHSAMARRTSHGPGSLWPSQVSAAPTSLTTSGSPVLAIVPCSISFR
jgi:hypothetical protein